MINADPEAKVSSVPSPRNEASAHQALVKELVDKFCDAALKKGVVGLCEEFYRMRNEAIPSPDSLVSFYENQDHCRNRYRDVPCLEETRVKLVDHPDGNDYIHANYVATPLNERRFICTQAPLSATCYDFWWMVMQDRVEYVLMLCNFFEEGKPKCFQYVPMELNASLTFDDITVTVTSMETLKAENGDMQEQIYERSLKVKRGDDERTITHFHWKTWPDHGVPSNDLAPLVLLQRVRHCPQPIVVHCSAGIGRTGSIVAIEYVLERIIYNQPCEEMSEVLKNLRKQRAFSIQTDTQYLYVHCILLRYYTELRYISGDNADLVKFMDDYNKVVGRKL